MFFGVAVRGPWAIPLGAILLVGWLLVQVFRAVGFLALLALGALAPLAGAGAVSLLGKLDSRYADRLETAEERRANGRERRQERAARASLYSHPAR